MQKEYQVIITHLEQRLAIIANTELRDSAPDLQLKQLQDVSENISTWHEQHKKNIPAQLDHFLTNASLVKALEYLKSGAQKCK